ncbi:WD repeat-containing protein jip5 [Coniothyrium glycines]
MSRQKSYQHIEHGSTCAHTLDPRDDCTCFYSALSKTSIFSVATVNNPSDILGQVTDEFQVDIQQFLETKRNNVSSRVSPTPGLSNLYTTLQEGEVRVIEIYPAEREQPLQGQLHTVSVDFTYQGKWDEKSHTTYTRHTNHAISMKEGKPFWYTALSYTWGKPDFNRTISLKHNTINITSSLAAALHHLRLTDQSVFLWIDQICINQSDSAEKARQIPLMSEIYAHSTNTIIWLGEEDDSDASLAFDVMETVYARLQGTDAKVTPDDFSRLDFPNALDKAWYAVRQLLRRPWFTRLWTIQEAHLSKRLFLKCGNMEAAWDDFAVWCYTLDDSGILQWLLANQDLDRKYFGGNPEDLVLPQGAAVVDSIQAGRLQGMTLVQKAYLLESLVSTRYAQATDAKDKIYGVLGMAEANVIPDYSATTTVRKVYHDACLTQLPHLARELLSCVDHDVPLRPSWVPDWSTPRVTTELGYWTKALTLYRAGGQYNTLGGSAAPRVSLSNDKSELSIYGKMFDTIAQLGRVCQDPVVDIYDPQASNRDLASCLDMIHDVPTSLLHAAHGMKVYDAFLYTLLAGRDGSGVLPPSQDHSEVFSLIIDSISGHLETLPGQTYSPRRQKGYFTLDSLRTRKPAKTLKDLAAALRAALKMRRFAITLKGHFALVPRGAQKGDAVVVLEDTCVPFVLRRVCDNAARKRFELLGESYVHGIMKGEVMSQQDIELEEITLV